MGKRKSRKVKTEYMVRIQGDVSVSLEMVDRMGDLAEEASDLADAIECTRMAALSPLDDSTDYIVGTLTVLMRASDSVRVKAAAMLLRLEGEA